MDWEMRAVVRGLAGLVVSDHGRVAQHIVGDWLAEQGFTMRYEVPVDERGDGHAGFVDLVAQRQGLRLAIEVDGRAPRRKSVIKLCQVPDAWRIVVVRSYDDWTGPTPEGIDAVASALGYTKSLTLGSLVGHCTAWPAT